MGRPSDTGDGAEIECGAPYPADMREKAVWLRQTMGQAADVLAAQGLAHDEMLAAGGPANSRAWVEYEAMTRRHAELLLRDPSPE